METPSASSFFGEVSTAFENLNIAAVAVSPLVEGVGGRYFEDCREATVLSGRAESDGRHGVAPFALDPENATRLWAVTEGLLGRS